MAIANSILSIAYTLWYALPKRFIFLCDTSRIFSFLTNTSMRRRCVLWQVPWQLVISCILHQQRKEGRRPPVFRLESEVALFKFKVNQPALPALYQSALHLATWLCVTPPTNCPFDYTSSLLYATRRPPAVRAESEAASLKAKANQPAEPASYQSAPQAATLLPVATQ